MNMGVSKGLFFTISLVMCGLCATAATTSVTRPEGLTDLTNPEGAAVTSENLLNNMSPQKAFNDSTSLTDTSNRFITNQKGTAVLVYTFDEATAVNAIGIQNFNNGNCQNRSPKAWTFWGSNDFDGTREGIATATWTKLDERTNETDWAKPEYRYYQFENNRKFKSYQINITDHDGGDNYIQIQKFEYFYYSPIAVEIVGSPVECGDFSYDPVVPEVGSTVTLSAFDGTWTDAAGTTSAVCTGHELLMNNVESGEWETVSAGPETTVTFKMLDACYKLTWKFDRKFKVKVNAAENGSASVTETWLDEGATCIPTVTAAEGYGFYRWEVAEGGPICVFDENFIVSQPTTLTPVFAPVVSLQAGSNVINDAVAAAEGRTILRLAPGEYAEKTGTANGLVLDKPVRIEGVAGETPVTIKRDTSVSSARVVKLDHAEAVIKGVTITGGYGASNQEPIQGGNVYITANGGTIMDSTISGGRVSTYNSCGGNVRMLGGHLLRCIIEGGYTQTGYGAQGGGGVNASGDSLVESCLIRSNTVGNYDSKCATASAGVRLTGTARMINCTLVKNGGTSAGYGAVYADGTSAVVNCAIFDNVAREDGTGRNQSWGGVSTAYENCFSDVLVNETCFQTTTPAFADADNGDYALSVASPLRDKGAAYSASGATSAYDLTGGARIGGAGVDVGAYEFVADGVSGDFTADKLSGLTPCEVTFTATVEGATGVVSYAWDFDGDGEVDETTTTPTVTHAYTKGGTYSVVLVATDAGSGKFVEATHADMIQTCQQILYVATDSTPELPYASWETAAATIADAVAAAVDGCEIRVADGDYPVSAEISVKKAVRIIGWSGDPTKVYVHHQTGSAPRCFSFDNANALVANMEMKGNATSNGKTVLFSNTGGAISNCIVHTVSSSTGWGIGGTAIFGARAFVTHCVVTGDGVAGVRAHIGDGAFRGGAVHLTGGSRIANTLIRDCHMTYDLGNSSSGGNILSLLGSTAVNCTLVNCSGSNEGSGGIYADGSSSVVNCVVYGFTNTAEDPSALWYAGVAANFSNCAPTDLAVTAFKDYANGDYRPKTGGPLSDKGVTPVGWAQITDLAGTARVKGKSIDIGCYEGNPAGIAVILR